jgi:hypothetical protein
MRLLVSQYQKISLFLLGVATLCYSVAYQFVIPIFQTNDPGRSPNFVVFLLSASGFYSIFYVVPLWLYKTVLWRIVNPSLVLAGYWKVTITYTSMEREPKDGRPKLPLPHSFRSAFRIKQSPFSIEIIQGISTPNEEYSTHNVEMDDNGGISYVYDINRSVDEDSPYPSRLKGYEKASVHKHGRWGRPALLSGYFHHLCMENIPLYRGKSRYERVSKDEYHKIVDAISSELSDPDIKVLPATGEHSLEVPSFNAAPKAIQLDLKP